MAIHLSAEDARIIAEIEAKAASNKTSKGEAKALIKEIKDAAAKRKTPKFNSKGQTEAKKEVPKKKAEAKKLSAESKTSTDTKVRRKKVNSSRGKPPAKTTVNVRRSGGPKFGPSTVKPKVKPATIGPAGEPHSPRKTQTAKASTKPSKLVNAAKNVVKKVAKFGKASPLAVALTSQKLGGGKDMIDPKNPPKLWSGMKKTVPTETKKAPTETKKAPTEPSSFGAAFRKNKDAGKSKFSWNGKSYTTSTKDEVKKSGSKNLREHENKKQGKKATSFGTAFAAAKKEGKKAFTFNGKSYSTKTK